MLGSLLLLVTPTPGHLAPSRDLCKHLHSCAHTHIQTHMHINKNKLQKNSHLYLFLIEVPHFPSEAIFGGLLGFLFICLTSVLVLREWLLIVDTPGTGLWQPILSPGSLMSTESLGTQRAISSLPERPGDYVTGAMVLCTGVYRPQFLKLQGPL